MLAHDGARYRSAEQTVKDAVGVVIPIFFASDEDAERGAPLVAETVEGFVRAAAPAAVCLSADGDGAAGATARRLAADCGARCVVSPRRQGKLGPVLLGMRDLLARGGLRYLAVADQDGDHFPNELLNLVRMAQHVEREAGTERVLVIGRRISRHRPMGWLRGELEELADRVLLDALHYHAAVGGRPLDLRYAVTLDEFPDFHSGYKLFTRASADAVFSADPWSEGLSEACTYRHAVEAVMSTEAVRTGSILAQVNRSTIDDQPLSAFGKLDRLRMTADKILWPCKRLGVPAEFVAQWVDNHLPRLTLGALAPQGPAELLAIRRFVREGYGLADDGLAHIPRPPFL